MARRVIQFPTRNAFAAQRIEDSLARDTDERDSQQQAHRIASQVEREIARLAERQATGRDAEFAVARNHSVAILRPLSRVAHFRKRFTSMPIALRAFATHLFSRQ